MPSGSNDNQNQFQSVHRQNSKGSLIPGWGKHTADHSVRERNGVNSLSRDVVGTQTSSGKPTLEFVRLCIVNALRLLRWDWHTAQALPRASEEFHQSILSMLP